MIAPKHDDGLHDAVAPVEAVGCGDLWVNSPASRHTGERMRK